MLHRQSKLANPGQFGKLLQDAIQADPAGVAFDVRQAKIVVFDVRTALDSTIFVINGWLVNQRAVFASESA